MPLLIALLSCLGPTPATARYRPPSLTNLLGASDLVATGTITEVRAEAFVLRFGRVIAGHPPGDTARIERFDDWACSRRWKAYAVGQRLFIMVQAVDHEDYDFALRSSGWESEFPLVGELVMIHGYEIPGAEVARLEGRLPAAALPLEIVAEATLDLRRCWGRFDKPLPTARCSSQETDALAERTVLHRLLIESLTAHAADHGSDEAARPNGP